MRAINPYSRAPSSWSRRDFLKSGLTAAGAAALPSAWANSLAPAMAQPMIDAHVHFYDPRKPGGVPWPPRDNRILYSAHLPADFRTITAGLNLAGVIMVEANAEPEDNRWALALAQNEPLIVGYIARLPVGQPEFSKHFNRYIASPIFRGLRLWPKDLAGVIDQAAFAKDLQAVAERGLVLELVGGPSMLTYLPQLEKIAPTLRLIIDHLPFPEWDQMPDQARTSLQRAAAHPQVYAKVSNILRHPDSNPAQYRARLDMLWEVFGPDRVIYGSNWPVSDLTGSYAAAHRVAADYVNQIGPAAGRKYFWENSLAYYRWIPRGRAAALIK